MSNTRKVTKQVRWARRMKDNGMSRITVWVPPGCQQAVRDEAHVLRKKGVGAIERPRVTQKPRFPKEGVAVPVRVWVPNGCRDEILNFGKELREVAEHHQ